MTHRENLELQLEDALFALLMDDIATEEGQALMEENERLKRDPTAAVPDELDKNCRKLIRSAFQKEQRKKIGHATIRILKRVAVVALLAALLFAIAYFAIPEFQVGVKNMIRSIAEMGGFTEMVQHPAYIPIDPSTGLPIEINNYTLPDVVDGYTLIDAYTLEDYRNRGYSYETPSGDLYTIDINAVGEGAITSIDTEDGQVIDIVINGYTGFCVLKNNGSVIVAWADTDHSVIPSIYATSLSKEQVIKMAEAIQYVTPTE